MSSTPFTHRLTKPQKKILKAVYEKLLAKEHLPLKQEFNARAIAFLVKRGLLVIEKMDRLIWTMDEKNVKRIDRVETVKLTEEGERIVRSFTKRS